ncbi:hypothetical protein ABN151_00325 [Klebsiella oxytoca]|uniref:hypothetical protein n=1 Tax=Klebsiella oxytoca TaxID=571 RepID=UPI0032D9D352
MKNGNLQFFILFCGYLLSAVFLTFIAWFGYDIAGLLGGLLPYLKGGMINSDYLPVSTVLNNYSMYIGFFIGVLFSLLMCVVIDIKKINSEHYFSKVFIGCVIVLLVLIFMSMVMESSDLVNANYLFRVFSYSYFSSVIYYLLLLFFFYIMTVISVMGIIVIPSMIIMKRWKKARV